MIKVRNICNVPIEYLNTMFPGITIIFITYGSNQTTNLVNSIVSNLVTTPINYYKYFFPNSSFTGAVSTAAITQICAEIPRKSIENN